MCSLVVQPFHLVTDMSPRGMKCSVPLCVMLCFTPQPSVDPLRLAAVVRSTEWKVFATTDSKLYFVSKKSQGM